MAIKGWLGDVPKFFYDTNKITDLTGWNPKMNSREAYSKILSTNIFPINEKRILFLNKSINE